MPVKQKFKNKKGQTLIEFALVSILFVFLLVITFNSVIAFTVQQYLSYATFMSARAFQASADEPSSQQRAARLILKQFIPNLPDSGTNFGDPGLPISFPLFRKPVAFLQSIQIPVAADGDYQTETAPSPNRFIGMVYTVPLAEIPLGPQIRSSIGTIRLQSRSFFGRQVSNRECRAFFRGFLELFRVQGASVPRNTQFVNDPRSALLMEDNGC